MTPAPMLQGSNDRILRRLSTGTGREAPTCGTSKDLFLHPYAPAPLLGMSYESRAKPRYETSLNHSILQETLPSVSTALPRMKAVMSYLMRAVELHGFLWA